MATTKPGERKLQILQTLAAMLEDPKGLAALMLEAVNDKNTPVAK